MGLCGAKKCFSASEAISFAVGNPAALDLLVELLMQMKPFEDKLGRRSHQGGRLLNAQGFDRFLETSNLFYAFQVILRVHLIGNLNAPAGVEVLDDF